MGKSTSNKRPARDAYWSSNRLRKRKVRNIMRHTGLSEDDATKLWTIARGNTRMR